MDIFTTQEKVQIVKWYFGGNSIQATIDLFIANFENRPVPTSTTVRRIISNFEKHGCVSPRNHKKPPAPPDIEVQNFEITVCANAEVNPTQSSRAMAQQFDVDAKKIRSILKKHGYRSYKLQKSNELFPEDQIRRMEFCETVMERANNDPNFIRNIVFTDESTFPLQGRHNPSVTRVWGREKPHRTYVGRTQYPQKLNVWVALLGTNKIGPFFINGNLTGRKYLDLLQNEVIPAIRRLPGVRFGDIWFQQDGCPAHNSRAVQEFLMETFPNRLISGRGTILWPARSPDLAPNDFFLWGYVKSQIYGFQEERANTLNELRIKIQNSVEDINPQILENVMQGFYNRLTYCLAQEGGLFEHLL